MATLSEILSIGQSGLNAANQMMKLASFNVANANTDGYARQTMTLQGQRALGLGVGALDPQSVKNPYIMRSLVQTFGRLGFYDGQAAPLASIEQTFNELDGEGLGTALSGFRNALELLASNPAGGAERQAVLDAAQAAADAFSSARTQLEETQQATHGQAQGLAQDITLTAREIASLNAKIRGAAPGSETNAMIDNRDQLVSELSLKIDLQVVPADDGTVRLLTAGGRPLVDGEFSSEVLVTSIGGPPEYGMDVRIKSHDGELLAAVAPVGGQLGGLLEVQNGVTGVAIGRLDELAHAMMTAMNEQHQAGFDIDGNAGEPLFEAIALEGAAGELRLTDALKGNPDRVAASTSDTGPSGNLNVLAMAGLFDSTSVTADGSTLLGAYDGLVSLVTSAVVSANAGQATEAASADQLASLLSSETGVSVDEELLAMTVANQAFQAAGTIISQTETMTATLLSLVG